MRRKLIVLALIGFIFAVPLSAQSTTPLGDTVIEGDLRVKLTSSGSKGNLNVDGGVKLTQSPASMGPEILSASGMSQADYYGPLQIGPHTYLVGYSFIPDAGASNGSISKLPLGMIGFGGAFEGDDLRLLWWHSGFRNLGSPSLSPFLGKSS